MFRLGTGVTWTAFLGTLLEVGCASSPSPTVGVMEEEPPKLPEWSAVPPTRTFFPAVDAWALRGPSARLYKGAVSRITGLETVSVSLQSRRALVRGFGTYANGIDATPFRGKRVRVRAMVETEDVRRWGGLWARVVRAGHNTAFANTRELGRSGTSPPVEHEIVLDVAADAESIRFGLILEGAGKISASDLRIDEIVPGDP